MKKQIFSFFTFVCLAFAAGCASTGASDDEFTFPDTGEFQGYTMVNGVGKITVPVFSETGERIAVVVRNPSVSQVALEPRYQNSMVAFEGVSDCGNLAKELSGCSVYRFSFIGVGDTAIEFIQRNKGLNPRAKTFPSDTVLTIRAKVDW